MLRVGEHIHGLELLHPVTALGKKREIPRQRLRIAGDVDDLFRGAAEERAQKALVAACAGRVEEHEVGPHPVARHLLHVRARVPGREPAVFDAVQARVRDRVRHRVAVELHADDLSGMGAGCDADGTDAAVGVQHGLRPGQPGKVHRCAVELLGLDGVDLIKRAGRDAEAVRAEDIFYIPVAVQHLFPRAQDDGAEAVVDVQHDGSDLRVLLRERFDEGLLRREDGACRDQHDQRLARGKAAPHQHVPQPAGAAALVIDPDPEIRQHPADRDEDRVRRPVLDQAVVHGDDRVAPRLIDPGDDLAVPVEREGGGHLVAVVGRLLHPEDRQHRAEAVQQLLRPPLLLGKLPLIWQVLQLAAPAFFRVGTGKRAVFVHVRLRTSIFTPFYHRIACLQRAGSVIKWLPR